MREGANQADFCRRIAALGVNVAVLSGEEEAILAHWGATGGKGGVVDIGGGSTQIICRNFAHSGPIGCVRAKELCASAGSLDEMRDIVFARCAALLRFPGEAEGDYTGLGGTIHTLAALLLELPAYDAAKVCAARIHPPQLKGLLDRLYTMGPKGRQAEPLLANRAETILPGGLILAYVLAKTGETSLAVSDRDGMEGYFLQKLQAGALSGGIGK